VVEEAPAPNLSEATKNKIAECAVALCQGVGYANAGTVEFMVDAAENFYFLEVNSRLQVEHSVTEAVWGIDLVKAQLKIAEGAKLKDLFPSREMMKPRGHAIQARIYAEDSANQFAPCPGPLALVEWPLAVGLRIDSGIRSGSVIGLDYDAMIAKMTVHAEDRPAALSRLLWCLRHTILFGTVTNVNYLQDILKDPEVQAGHMHVKILETKFGGWKDEVPEEILSMRRELAASAAAAGAGTAGDSTAGRAPSPWESL
jgi:acetyl/propionyl-CoA carboxylase alpha subunit